jgi:hypothetical protein
MYYLCNSEAGAHQGRPAFLHIYERENGIFGPVLSQEKNFPRPLLRKFSKLRGFSAKRRRFPGKRKRIFKAISAPLKS